MSMKTTKQVITFFAGKRFSRTKLDMDAAIYCYLNQCPLVSGNLRPGIYAAQWHIIPPTTWDGVKADWVQWTQAYQVEQALRLLP